MSKRLLCVWLPNWPVQRVQAEEPLLANVPLILSVRDARRGLVVAAANLLARTEGIRPGMRLSEATALVDAEVREHDPQEDIDALCSLTEQAQQFSPIVGLEQLDKKMWAGRTLHQPESLLLDITGLASLFGGEAKLLHKAASWLREKQYFGCMGVGSSVGAAWALANYATRTPQAHEVPEPSEADPTNEANRQSANPSCVPLCRFYIASSDRNSADRHSAGIAALPLAALRLPTETIISLQRLGVRVIGQLETLPRAGMATRLGDDLLSRWDQATGIQQEPIVTLHSQPDWCLEQDLEYPTQHRETIAEIVRRLSRDLSQRLNQRGEGALRIVCRLDLVQTQPLIMQLGLFRPTNEAGHLTLLLCGQLEQYLRHLGAAAIWRVSLQATMTAAMAWRQTDLFDGGEAASRQQIARLVDTLSSRLGRKQVLSAHTKRESQPELAFTLQPMTGRKNDGSDQATIKKLSSRLARRRAEPDREDPLRRPTHLFQNPVPIEVRFQNVSKHTIATSTSGASICTNETHLDSSPALRLAMAPSEFKHLGSWHPVIDARGPERLESGWWRGPSSRRDYYRVATKQGSWWWLYRELNTGQWYIHGMFD